MKLLMRRIYGKFIKFQEEWCQNRECYSIPVLNNENIGIMHILAEF